MPIYEFYWEDGSFLLEIDADPKTVEKLLDEYKKLDEDYDDLGWIEFLEEKGIKVREIAPEHSFYF